MTVLGGGGGDGKGDGGGQGGGEGGADRVRAPTNMAEVTNPVFDPP